MTIAQTVNTRPRTAQPSLFDTRGADGRLWAAISIGKSTAQGPVVARHENGTVSIDTGLGIVTSRPV